MSFDVYIVDLHTVKTLGRFGKLTSSGGDGLDTLGNGFK